MSSRAPLILACLLLCAAVPAAPAPPALPSVLLAGVPHVRQQPDFCGEACVAMWLGKLGHGGDQGWVFDQSGLDPLLGRGVHAAELVQALRRIGFQQGAGWYQVDRDEPAQLEAQFRVLHADLVRGVPSVVCMHYDDRPDTTEHFRLVLGYDAARDEVIYHEPAARDGAYRRMRRAMFLSLWPLKYERARWTVIRLPLEAGALRPRGGTAQGPTAADYAQHVMALRGRMPDGFSLALAPPFVVIGDGGQAAVQRAAVGVVSWTVSRLKERYFAQDPPEILDVWLFRDATSYQTHVKRLFGEAPDTPYGYYSPKHRALIMNIATGGGTLVHEIVHPYVHANFPEAPAWFNEGLGSLYEQSAEVGGQIVGLTNWRLEGLQRALRAGRVPSFHTLATQSDADFYDGPHSATSYAQARYLLYYLQERGLLQAFYRRYYRDRGADPGGYRTLQSVLGERDMEDFQQRWGKWVLGLRFEG